MSAITIPLGRIRMASKLGFPCAARREALAQPLPKGEEKPGGVEKVGGFFNTSYYPRAGGAVESECYS